MQRPDGLRIGSIKHPPAVTSHMNQPDASQYPQMFGDRRLPHPQAANNVADRPLLQAHASYLRQYPTTKAIVQGNTDERGSREYNVALGQKRADAVKRALLAAKSIAYSDSASGVYVSTEMFDKLGIADAMKDKARKIPATPVGEIVAHGDAEIGLQQISELQPVPGIDIVGSLPDDLQKITVFSAGIATVSKEPDAGKALIKFLGSPTASAVIVKSGLEPIPAAATN